MAVSRGKVTPTEAADAAQPPAGPAASASPLGNRNRFQWRPHWSHAQQRVKETAARAWSWIWGGGEDTDKFTEGWFPVATLSPNQEPSVKVIAVVALTFLGILRRDNRLPQYGGGGDGYHGTYYLQKWFPLAIALVDEADLGLDIALGVRLTERDEETWAVLLLGACLYAQAMLLVSTWVRNFVGMYDSAFNTAYWGMFSLVVFMLEDSTTMAAFATVDGLVSRRSWLDVANLVITLGSALYVAGLLLWAIAAKTSQHLDFGVSRQVLVPLLLCVAWVGCVVVVHVIAGVPLPPGMKTAITVIHALFYGVSLVLSWHLLHEVGPPLRSLCPAKKMATPDAANADTARGTAGIGEVWDPDCVGECSPGPLDNLLRFQHQLQAFNARVEEERHDEARSDSSSDGDSVTPPV